MHEHREGPHIDEQRLRPSQVQRSPEATGALRSPSALRAMSPASLLSLQRSVGNAGTTVFVQREEEEKESEEEEQVQRVGETAQEHAAHGAHDESPSPVHATIQGGGSPLDAGTRDTMEQHLGGDFSSVRLHVDRQSAESVKAAAYTVGDNVVVHPDHYQPGTPQAQRTLAHELTHVQQQRSGPVSGTPQAGGIQVSDPSDRFEQEAEASATRFSSRQAEEKTEEPAG
ncbi:MAG: hypothetical protein JWM85_2084 [Acidimicrobiaceae bacterium]|nr:hypothetical protein [Acidimicrobiaceae bacterium]